MISDAKIRALRPKRRRYAVTVRPRLQVVVMPSGAKSWVFRVASGGNGRAMKLGAFPSMTAGQAMKMAQKLNFAVAMETDPAKALETIRRNARQRLTVTQFARRWYADVVMKNRKDPRPVERLIRREIEPAIGGRQLRSIEITDLTRLVFAKRDSGHPEAAAALRHALKRMFDYAIACQEATVNPAAYIPMKYVARHKARTRTLSGPEIRLFLQRLPAMGRIGWALELMLLTMCRKSELRLARWEHVDFEKCIWEIPPEASKTGNPHIVYLSPRALVLFKKLWMAAGMSPHVLPLRDSVTEPMGAATINKAVARVKWGFPHFTPHDLRRTASTHLNELGYNPDWIEACLNHAPKGVRGVYNRARWAEQRRQMLEDWANFVARLSE